MGTLVTFRNKFFKFFYKWVFRPLLFLFDPENIHDCFAVLGRFLGEHRFTRKLISLCFDFQDKALEQTIWGFCFKNPIGLAAGFDKNGYLIDILPQVGFGFAEIGSITGEPCPGNPKPRIWRLPRSESLCVYYGLANEGSRKIALRLDRQKFPIPVGINVAKTNDLTTDEIEQGVADYLKACRDLQHRGDYFAINISCPNTAGGEPFLQPENLDRLLSEIDKAETNKPVLVKLSPDLAKNEVDALLEVCGRHKVQGLICSNLTKQRRNPKIKDKIMPYQGGLSGKAVEDLSNELIAYVYKKTQGKYVIVGCGGIFSAEDAYKKIRLGAGLLQLITGMIYEGPQLISEINYGLVGLLKRDGFKNIAEAVGKDVR